MTDAITLHADAFWISPYAFTCFVALREKGVSFEVVEVALHEKAQRRADYRARSLTGRIPALAHGDFWLNESLAILEYVEETFPAPDHPRILPAETRDRARARELLSWVRSDETLPIRQERSAEVIFYERPLMPLSEPATQATAKLFEMLGRVIRSADQPVFTSWSIVDAEIAFLLHRLLRGGDTVPDDLRRYAEAQWRRPSVAEYVGHQRREFIPYL